MNYHDETYKLPHCRRGKKHILILEDGNAPNYIGYEEECRVIQEMLDVLYPYRFCKNWQVICDLVLSLKPCIDFIRENGIYEKYSNIIN
jgi:hypothetical protein